VTDPDRWEQIEELFKSGEAAVNREAAEFLREACPDGARLRAELCRN
jgi:hypothetical protein